MNPATSEEHRPRPGPRRWWVRLALGLLVTGALVAALLTQVDPRRAVDTVIRADPGLVALGGLLYLLLVLVRSLRYRGIAPEVPMRTLVGVHAVHALLLRVMPLRSGELGFAWLMQRADAGGFSKNLVGLLMLRILDFAAMLVLFAVGLVLFGGAPFVGVEVRIVPWVLAGLLALAAPLYLRPLLRVALRAFDALLALTRLDRLDRLARLQGSVRGAVEWSQGVATRTLWWATAWTALQWALNYLLFYVLLGAMGVEVSVAQTVLGGTGSAIGTLLPLAGIGSFGTLETGWALGFAAVGVEPEVAVASAFGFSVISVGYSVVCGLAGWALIRRPG